MNYMKGRPGVAIICLEGASAAGKTTLSHAIARTGAPRDLGSRLDQMTAWLGANCGADAWAITPSGIRASSTMPSPSIFSTRRWQPPLWFPWCATQRPEIVDGTYRVRNDEPTPRIGAGLQKTP
jgi:hypothetical protein